MTDEGEAAPGDEPPAEEPSKKHDQAFFLDLAAKRKDAWNAWRRDPANKDVRVTFARIDFSEAPRDRIDFSGFEFGDHADFSGCKWRGGEWQEIEAPEAFVPGRASFAGAALGHEAKFTGANFGDQANFTSATFRHGADFIHAVFGYAATFPGAAFGHRAKFTGANFGHRAKFTDAIFADEASFTKAAFGCAASFLEAAFGSSASFDDAAFGSSASFDYAVFGNQVNFTGAAFAEGASFDDSVFKGRVEFTGNSKEQWSSNLDADGAYEKIKEARVARKKRHEDLWTHRNSGPNRFLTISFANARFEGEADFSGRSFERVAEFTNVRFYRPPDFDTATGLHRIDFSNTRIGFVSPGKLHWTSDIQVPLHLRALRKLAEETKNHDLERDLYIEERKAERGIYLFQRFVDLIKEPVWKWPANTARLLAHLLWIVVMGVYWALADYGRSFARPFAWLIASVFFFYWRYLAILTPLMAKAGAPDLDKYKQALRMLALGNTVPFVGPLTIDGEIKRFLFCPGCDAHSPAIPPEGYQLLVVGQNLLSIILVFFIGLALRNYFKIK
jgi:hypothetical protein